MKGTKYRLHLIGAKTKAQMAGHAAIVASFQKAAAKAGRPEPKLPDAPVLNFHGFSGRGVRLRMLSSLERSEASQIAGKEVGPEGTAAEFNERRNRNWIFLSLVEVTKEAGLDEAGLAAATWVKTAQQQLDEPTGPMSAAELFTSKDMDALSAWFTQRHCATMDDIEAITGNAVELVED